jgi:hypothetical protein
MALHVQIDDFPSLVTFRPSDLIFSFSRPNGTHFNHPYGANRSDSPPIHFIHYPSAALSSIFALLALRPLFLTVPLSHLLNVR